MCVYVYVCLSPTHSGQTPGYSALALLHTLGALALLHTQGALALLHTLGALALLHTLGALALLPRHYLHYTIDTSFTAHTDGPARQSYIMVLN
jgi:hypothetical protein